MSQIKNKFIGNNEVSSEKVLLENDSALRARNQADSADVDLIKLNTSDEVVIKDLAAPVDPNDAASKDYVDTAVASVEDTSLTTVVAAVTGITSGQIASFPVSTVDGQAVTNGDLLLIFGSAPADTGVYVFNGVGNALTRAPGWDSEAEFVRGRQVYVPEGTANGRRMYVLSVAPATLGTNPVEFIIAGVDLQNIPIDLIPATNGQRVLGSTSRVFSAVYSTSFGAQNPSDSLETIGLQYRASNTSLPLPAGENYGLYGFASNIPVSIVTLNSTGADANPSQDIQLYTGNKTAGTGDSGSINLITGTSAGGSRGAVSIDSSSLRLLNSSGTANISFPVDSFALSVYAPDSLAADRGIVLPGGAPAAGHLVATDEFGSWSYVDPSSLAPVPVTRVVTKTNNPAAHVPSGPASVGGVSLSNGDLVLADSENANALNGVYVFNGVGVAMTRAPGWQTTDDFAVGKAAFVAGGTWQSITYINTTLNPTVDTTPITMQLNTQDNKNLRQGIEPASGVGVTLGSNQRAFSSVHSGAFVLGGGGNEFGRLTLGSSVNNGAFTSATNFAYIRAPQGAFDAGLGSLNATGSQNSGGISLLTGTAVDGSSGSIKIGTGTISGTGTRGDILLGAETVDMTGVDNLDLTGVNVVGLAAGETYEKEQIQLSAGDITNQYVTLANVPKATSVMLFAGGLCQLEGIDWEIDGTNPDQINFLGDLATGGASELVENDYLVISYSY